MGMGEGALQHPAVARFRMVGHTRDESLPEPSYTNCYNTDWWHGDIQGMIFALQGNFGPRGYAGEMLVGQFEGYWTASFNRQDKNDRSSPLVPDMSLGPPNSRL